MKFLTFVDLHEDKKILNQLIDRAQQDDIDFIITAGDLTMFSKGLRFVLKNLNKINKPVYLIPGNHETEEEINNVIADYPNCININHHAIEVGDYVIFGYGEGGFAKEDSQFRKIARSWYGKHQNKKSILVIHGPPFGTKLDRIDNHYVGNQDYRKFIERIKPKLVICGHIHETAGKIDTLNDKKTKIINPGWEGMVLELY